MSIAELLTEDLISEDIQGKNKYRAIEELLDLLVDAGKIKDRETCLQDLIEREQYLSTGLENGLAVPHAKSAAVSGLVVSFGLSHEGIDFDSLDGKPAHFIFLVLSPRDTSGPHIKILAQITRNFREGDTGKKLLEAKEKKEIVSILHNFK
ncbi:MAG: PTS sugar transporter subunit IIA [Calditrichaeota bacterium]|nr:PTS sugar transporter subunit IIA [Calditrichota bacterium]RQW06960.1 MAG: PTS sugar transporter subunit IIA [Calditrichota bacterium]